jgi:uncharacterized membrane protein
MFERNFLLLQLPATLGAGLIAGTFFCFSSFVMPALMKLEPTQGIVTMQKINITVINPLFMAVLFGTAILYVVQAYVAVRPGLDGTSFCWLAAALLYVVGTIGITMIGNVPLNDQLATLLVTDTHAIEFWESYGRHWTAWNSLRGTMAVASCITSVDQSHVVPMRPLPHLPCCAAPAKTSR